ncbi:STAS domain-containing protein [Aliirhizobium terrae]|uniref:STAS domain-containing protein n=1 Tax=Terrirhizobium terrae TaxID=2926709 RepID=UPI002577933F|nr:STAS domain-containing protein [Rhizobium sp. CC-CFT758]WJH41745.1 STAS domain-containing protein [Rhizobium sp. CC-CFT758]
MNTSGRSEASLSLPANLTVRAITSAREDLLTFMDAHEAATIMLADDVQVDISFIQMIEAARIHAGTAGKSIALSQPANGALLETLRRSGFLEGMSAEDAKFWLHQGVNQ